MSHGESTDSITTPRTMVLTTPSFLFINGTNGRLGGEGHDCPAVDIRQQH